MLLVLYDKELPEENGCCISLNYNLDTMQKYSKYISLSIAVIFMILGIYVLLGRNMNLSMSKEVRVIFSIFLILYGAYRLARILTKEKMEEDE